MVKGLVYLAGSRLKNRCIEIGEQKLQSRVEHGRKLKDIVVYLAGAKGLEQEWLKV